MAYYERLPNRKEIRETRKTMMKHKNSPCEGSRTRPGHLTKEPEFEFLDPNDRRKKKGSFGKGLCLTCGEEVSINSDGTLRQHSSKSDQEMIALKVYVPQEAFMGCGLTGFQISNAVNHLVETKAKEAA